MTTTTLSVPDISCGHCKTSIEGAVSSLPGIEAVEVVVDDKTVGLAFDDDTVSLDDIITTIEEQGYTVSR